MAVQANGHDGGTSASLRIALLGPPIARLGERELRLGPPRQLAVLALLAARAGQAVAREEIIAGVWGDDQPSSAENSVHTYVSGLRRIIEPARANRQPGQILVSHDSAYELRLPREAIDVWEFSGRLDDADRRWRSGEFDTSLELLNTALGLWRGPAFSGIPGPFAETEQLRYEELRLTAVERRGEVLLALGQHDQLVTDLQRLTREYPLRERARHLLMRALYRCDRQADALAEFQDARRSLVDELGVEPGHALQALHAQILRADPALDLAAAEGAATVVGKSTLALPSQLPRRVATFTGRKHELGRLHDLLDEVVDDSEDPLPIVLITGPAGVGKTSFAVHFAHAVARRFDGQIYINLHGFDRERASAASADVLGSLLATLGVGSARIPAGLENLIALYRSTTADKRLLLVLDNAASAEQVRPLLPGGTGCAVIVTSRSRLGGLVARDGAHPVVLAPLHPTESVDLLAGVIGRQRVDAEPAAAARIAELCGGLPLAVRIAAERIATRAHVLLADVAEDLGEEAGRLDVLTVRGDDETTARTVFSWSYRHLDAKAAQCFRLLGLHPGVEFGVGVVAAMLDLAAPQTREQLDALASVHLVEEVRHGRYRLHDLVRLYANELSQTEDNDSARTDAIGRLLGWYLTMAERASNVLAPWQDLAGADGQLAGLWQFRQYDEVRAWFDAELTSLVAAAELAMNSGCPEFGWRIPLAEFYYLHIVKNWTLWVRTYEVALRAAQAAGDPYGEAWMHHGLSVAEHGRGNLDSALDHSRRALDIRRAIGDRDGEAWSLHAMGLAELGRHHFADAAQLFGQSIEIRDELNDAYGKAVTQIFLAETVHLRGDTESAIKLAEAALTIFTELGTAHGQGHALNLLGCAYTVRQDHDKAADSYRRALRVCREAGDEHGEGDALRGLGKLMAAVGANDEAREYLTQALSILQRRDDPMADDVRAQLAST
ncbi:DNA-binding SARP family transcriptional activator [Kutzneria buriramensis]|uniref:DNA-binding SARP family transcriptional activator n=2 Tax=Kutzneria buriramensis TaxID=1045776 RepID=A0A3E0GUQ5_9PSEU|nr:DNA-binding SARP family transcriptional activator [Kutzneria buriramensis]